MRKLSISWITVGLLVLAIKIFSLFPGAVENYYSNGLYRYISKFQRAVFGKLSFSIGDIVYAIAIVYSIVGFIQVVKKIIRREADRTFWWKWVKKIVFVTLWVYTVFNLLWGLNYNREGIAKQWKLKPKEVKKEEIVALMDILLKKVNKYDSLARLQRERIGDHDFLFDGAIDSYSRLAINNPLMNPVYPSLKASLFGSIGNYLGYTGYYNPFTGEAQVNTAVPLFIQPFTSCHEIGHQLGYAKENEANFSGYLSAKSSKDPLFLYSVYFDLYAYGRPYLRMTDSIHLKALDSLLGKGVRMDFKELRDFYQKHENPVESIIDQLYGQFLKANQQPAGKVTYGQVILWLVAYWRQYGEEAI